jgi:hypothetical protein
MNVAACRTNRGDDGFTRATVRFGQTPFFDSFDSEALALSHETDSRVDRQQTAQVFVQRLPVDVPGTGN